MDSTQVEISMLRVRLLAREAIIKELTKQNREMLEALKEIDEWWAGGDCPIELQDKMRAAIKKAEGRE